MADASATTDDSASTRGVTLSEMLRRALATAGGRGWLPGRVERYDATTRKADVQILVDDFHRDETGALVVDRVPIVTSVPVDLPTAGGYTITLPIVAGGPSATLGTLHFAERSLDRWLAGSGAEVDPEIYSRWNLTDARFIPGVLPFGAPPSSADPTDHMTVGSIAGVRIHLRASTICIGDESSGSDFVALAGKVLTELNAIKAAFSAHTHTLSVSVPGITSGSATATGTGVSGAAATYSPSSVAATQAKAH